MHAKQEPAWIPVRFANQIDQVGCEKENAQWWCANTKDYSSACETAAPSHPDAGKDKVGCEVYGELALPVQRKNGTEKRCEQVQSPIRNCRDRKQDDDRGHRDQNNTKLGHSFSPFGVLLIGWRSPHRANDKQENTDIPKRVWPVS